MDDVCDQTGFPLGRTGRVLLVLWSLIVLAGFAVALSLEPDTHRYGTHQELGLPPCTSLVLFDIPCPSCGMTTSFSHFVRGQFKQAAQANTAGVLLAAICAAQIPWCWLSAYQGHLWRVRRPHVFLLCVLSVLSGVCVVQWTSKLLLR